MYSEGLCGGFSQPPPTPRVFEFLLYKPNSLSLHFKIWKSGLWKELDISGHVGQRVHDVGVPEIVNKLLSRA